MNGQMEKTGWCVKNCCKDDDNGDDGGNNDNDDGDDDKMPANTSKALTTCRTVF